MAAGIKRWIIEFLHIFIYFSLCSFGEAWVGRPGMSAPSVQDLLTQLWLLPFVDISNLIKQYVALPNAYRGSCVLLKY